MSSNKDYLSQEEIDALLNHASSPSEEGNTSSDTSVEDILTSLEQDALGEIGNITFGSAATALSTLLGKKVDITTPKVSIVRSEALQSEFPEPNVAVHVNYVEGFQGVNLLVIQKRDAQVIANLMLGGDGTIVEEELNEIHISAVQEAMNQMMGSSATSMSTIFNRLVNISPPGIDIMDLANGQTETPLPQEEVYVKISFRLKIDDLIDSTIMQLLTVSFAKEMVNSLMGGSEAAEEVAATAVEEPPAPAPQAVPQQAPMHDQQPPAASVHQAPPVYQEPYAQPPYYEPSAPASGHIQHQRNVNVQPVEYTQFQPQGFSQATGGNLNLLMDIPLKVTVELGRTSKLVREILELSQGSIIELDKLAGEPVDILVNNKLVAKGEVVVIDENFGVRVTDIVSQADRLKNIQ
ncbi:flagellar motor switch phosphatase FliY [Marinicrinis lubricantis]|uniref:Flagellar motor switch phosphatase FliY n=1 Tax=Marinicrinis lubricantis TaxID=2086470 RepID=A0ABW1IME0_9BACL